MHTIDFVGDLWLARLDEGGADEDILRIAAAMGRLAQESRPESVVYVGYDARPLSVAIAHEVAEVIASFGVRARVSDTHCPVPALCQATREDSEAFAGLMLTAGNRPFDYVGVRVCVSDGTAATSNDVQALESYVVPELPSARGEAEEVDIITPYLENIASFINTDSIAQAHPLVACDVMYGPMAGHAPRLLSGLGAQVIEIHGVGTDDFDGVHPEVVEPWIDDCEQAVTDGGASFGFALDGAGERIALIDEQGRFVSPHMMLAIVMQYLVKQRGITGRMVAPIFLSSLVKRQAERLGMQLTVTPAGYMWMREEMALGDVVCAGDALGGVAVPAVALERDALVTAAVLCEAISIDGRPVSQIVDELDATLGHMVYGRRDVRMGSGEVQMLRNTLPGINPEEVAGKKPVSVSHSAGSLRLAFADDSWVLVRPSRNSAAARVYAEAATPAERDELLSAGEALAKAPLG